MTTPAYSDANFRAQFPEFASTSQFPTAQLSMYWTMGTAYVTTVGTDAQNQLANDLMGAHLVELYTQAANGASPGVTTGATEGSVSVTLQPPPSKGQFTWWLNQTIYGQQLVGLLLAIAATLQGVGGSYERSGFRKAGGYF